MAQKSAAWLQRAPPDLKAGRLVVKKAMTWRRLVEGAALEIVTREMTSIAFEFKGAERRNVWQFRKTRWATVSKRFKRTLNFKRFSDLFLTS